MQIFVSIIIPTLNAKEYIYQCLSSVANFDYPKELLEAIVVDNGSTDDTVTIANQFKAKVLVKTNCTISALRNFGAISSKGDILAFLDADCIPPRNWLRDAVDLLKADNTIGAVGSWYALSAKPSFIAKAWDAHMGNRRAKIGNIDWVPSGSLIILRHVFEKIGGFNETLFTSEDVDICERIKKAGYKIFAHPKLSVVHLGNPKGINDFFVKEMWRGKGVSQNFLRGFPRVKFNKAIIFALVTLLCILGAVIGIFFWRIYGFRMLFFWSLAVIIFISLGLSMKAVVINKNWLYLIPLTFLFVAFGFSRAFSFFSISAWKYALKGRRQC